MRTTIAIDDKLIGELMRFEPGVSRSEAMRRAVTGHVRGKRIEQFLTLAGSRLVDLDWREAEQHELRKLRHDG